MGDDTVDAGKTIRILYIDDDDALAMLMRRNLSRRGFTVEWAEDGATGLKRVAEGGIDAVILDHFLKAETGLDILPTPDGYVVLEVNPVAGFLDIFGAGPQWEVYTGVYDWVGASSSSAATLMDRLDVVAQRPLVDIVPVAANTPSADGDGAMAALYPQTTVRRPPVALRVEQTLANGSTPSRTVFGLRRYLGCWWITL